MIRRIQKQGAELDKDVVSGRSSPGFELSKNKWGVDICLFIVIVITHRRFSIINNGGGLELTPQGIPGHLAWGVEQTTRGVQPPTPRQFKHWSSHILSKTTPSLLLKIKEIVNKSLAM
jgi:hypothetical protein